MAVVDPPIHVWSGNEREVVADGAVDAYRAGRFRIARSGIDAESIKPPPGGRAPGCWAGLVVARRQEVEAA